MTKVISTMAFLLWFGFHSKAQINFERIDSIVQEAVTNDFFEGTVLIANSGNVVYQKSFGFVDKGAVDPIENSTNFGIASITKMVTAIIILQLVEEGKIHLEDKLSALIPELNIPQANKITVHHLLLHISGLPNEDDEIYTQSKSPQAFVRETLENKLNRFGKFNYANIDYVLLGLIIEKYDNTTWRKSVQNRIIDKVSMARTGFLEKGKYPSNFAYTFSYGKGDKKKPDPLFYIENFYSAGCMYATAEDLLKLDQAMYGDELLSEKSKELMFTSYPEYNYSGYSVWTYNYPFVTSKPKIMERRGGILGSNSVLIRIIEMNRTIIILSNNNKFNPDSFGNTKSLKEALMVETIKTGR
jgi:CubicO group peptidase (beta-lactamase class C family)